jgi:hypothetical protein
MTTSSVGFRAQIVSPPGDIATYLLDAIDDSETTITVANGAGFPTPPFSIQIGNEVMTVTGVVGDTWTVVRGGSPSSHLAGSLVITC